jgi:NitT/TauT family transport system substrate-binding protein
MKSQSDNHWSRREFLKGVTLAGTGALLGLASESIAAEPPETNKLTILLDPGPCGTAPKLIAEDSLRGEGFTDLRYVLGKGGRADEELLASGKIDLMTGFVGRHIIRVDGGDPTVILAGLHAGCYELFGTDQVLSIRDLKGKRVAVTQLTAGRHILFALMAAQVGLDPHKDINWITEPAAKSIQLFAERKIDAFMAFPLEPQELRAKKIGRVVINMMMDRPWSQYFCCMVAANREFVRKNPVATKRALRSILHAADTCAREPERAARVLVDKGFAKNYEYALDAMKEIAYGKWRDYDPEDTMRYYALRLQEVGMIKSSPQKIISQGTDWRFLREIKKELKA